MCVMNRLMHCLLICLCEWKLFAEALHHCRRPLSFMSLPVTASHCRLEHGGIECGGLADPILTPN